MKKNVQAKRPYEPCVFVIVPVARKNDVITTSATNATGDPYRDDVFGDNWGKDVLTSV